MIGITVEYEGYKGTYLRIYEAWEDSMKHSCPVLVLEIFQKTQISLLAPHHSAVL